MLGLFCYHQFAYCLKQMDADSHMTYHMMLVFNKKKNSAGNLSLDLFGEKLKKKKKQ